MTMTMTMTSESFPTPGRWVGGALDRRNKRRRRLQGSKESKDYYSAPSLNKSGMGI